MRSKGTGYLSDSVSVFARPSWGQSTHVSELSFILARRDSFHGLSTGIHQIEAESANIKVEEMPHTKKPCCGVSSSGRHVCGLLLRNWTAIGLYISVFCVILPICCHKWYFSVYYNQKLHLGGASPSVYARKVNDECIVRAVSFFSQKRDAQLPRTTNDVKMVIGFVTIKRKGEIKDGGDYKPRYLLQTVAGLLQERLPDTIHVLICNVATNPSSHTDAAFLSKYVTVVSRYGKYGAAKPPGHLQDKEREDYIFCLNQSLSYNPRYVLLLEDDALVVPGAVDVLVYVVDKIEDRRYRFEASKTLAKLYSPLSLQRDFYTDKPSRIVRNLLELLSIGLFGGSLLRILYTLLCERNRENHRLLDGYFVASLICCVLAALAISRPHLLELRRISKQLYMVLEANDCCTQAILYHREVAKSIVSQFEKGFVPDWYPIDAGLDYLAEKLGLAPVCVEPNLFTHIGMYSALHEGENVYLKDFA
ncbi:post-GPI attachment to proteins factor 4-like [Branchiostoma floridae]|uniref:Post-GPI attachment to proteins factor 4-like n=1 Tax=Branchiostoma floridae TaxID=7739 RepID=A0A9J7KVL8_BRAFL|nr:post-GPI attachment to proteins factor 4-like [Branchiostoma floridae]